VKLGVDIARHGAATLGAHPHTVFYAGLRQMGLKSGRHVKVLCKKVLDKMHKIPKYSCLVHTGGQRLHQQSCYCKIIFATRLCSQIPPHCLHSWHQFEI